MTKLYPVTSCRTTPSNKTSSIRPTPLASTEATGVLFEMAEDHQRGVAHAPSPAPRLSQRRARHRHPRRRSRRHHPQRRRPCLDAGRSSFLTSEVSSTRRSLLFDGADPSRRRSLRRTPATPSRPPALSSTKKSLPTSSDKQKPLPASTVRSSSTTANQSQISEKIRPFAVQERMAAGLPDRD